MEDQKVPIADAAVKGHLVAVEAFGKRMHQRLGPFRGDVSGGVVLQNAVFHKDQIAAPGDVVGPERNPPAGRLDRTASRIEARQIISENGHVRRIGGGGKSFGKSQKRSGCSLSCNGVHARSVDRLQRSPAAECFNGFIRHAVGKKNNGFPFQTLHDVRSSVSYFFRETTTLFMLPSPVLSV